MYTKEDYELAKKAYTEDEDAVLWRDSQGVLCLQVGRYSYCPGDYLFEDLEYKSYLEYGDGSYLRCEDVVRCYEGREVLKKNG